MMEPNRFNSLDNLDIEYLHILSIIKPYITCIMNNGYIEMIKLWLEKLSNDARIQKMRRNQYLLCLGKQIEHGVLNEPFIQAPPEELIPIEDIKRMTGKTFDCGNKDNLQVESLATSISKRKKKKSMFTNADNCSDYSDSSWQDLSDENTLDCASGDASNRNCGIENTFPFKYESDVNKLMNVIDTLRIENAALNQMIEGYSTGNNGNREIQGIVSEVEMLKVRLHELLDIKTALQSSHFSVANEWQSAISSLHKKLTNMQRKNCELKNVINHLETKLNDALNKNSAVPQKCMILTDMHKKEIQHLKKKHQQELDKLEKELTDRLNEKCLSFSKKFEDLQKWYEKQLSDMQADNERSLREFYMKQVEDMRTEFEKEMRQFCDVREAQILGEKKHELEEEYRLKASRLVSNDDALKEAYQKKLEQQKCEYDKDMRFKEAEIERLETLLQEQCKRMQEEVQTIRNQLESGVSCDEATNEKILFLQKCVYKLDKLYRRAEKEFAKQLMRLRHEMDMREKHNQIVMGTQRVKIISNSNANKQKEIDDIVNKLEQHYKTMLIHQQKEALEQKRADMKVISGLNTDLAFLKAKVA